MGFSREFLHIFNHQNRPYMDTYIITLGTYLILMLFCKVYYAVAIKD